MATSFIADINNLADKAKTAGCDVGNTRVTLCSKGSLIYGIVYNE